MALRKAESPPDGKRCAGPRFDYEYRFDIRFVHLTIASSRLGGPHEPDHRLMKRAILCVVKGPRDVQAVAALEHVWDIASTGEAAHALDMLAQRQFEVVLADSRVPGRAGMSFLTLGMNRYPAVLRILMFDPADTAGQPQALQGDPASQHWMAKPCTAERLKAGLEKPRTLQSRLDAPAILPLLARL